MLTTYKMAISRGRSQQSVPTLCLLLFLVSLSTASCFAEAACQPKAVAEPTPAQQAYKEGKYESADSQYVQALAVHPSDAALNASLIQTLLHENRIDDAAGRATKALSDDPQSAEILTAQAEVQLRQGHPWLAAQTLDHAAAIDPCNARAHYVRSRIYRIDSMYASERAELVTAYRLDPNDADIWHRWLQIIRPADEITSITQSLKDTPNLDADTREKAVASVQAMRPLLSENSKTCETAALSAPISIPLIASYASVKEVNGYKLRVDLPKSSLRMVLDTAASGLFVTRAVADANGFEHADADPPGTVRAASIHVGPLELHNCLMGVSETPFADGGDGFVGTDVFADNLITLNFPQGRLELAPMPEQTGELPGDRPSIYEREGYTPVFHRNQFLLLPVTLNKTDRELFILDTGVRLTTMTSAAAHAVSKTRVNFTNTVKTVSGGNLQVYRDAFDLQFANLSLDDQKQIIEFDPTALDENVGFQVSGMLGFNILRSLAMQINYRDGVVKFTSPASGPARVDNIAAANGPASPGTSPEQMEACNQYGDETVERPTDTLLEAALVGGLDSARLKPGQAVTMRVKRGWGSSMCVLTPQSHLYGHVLSATSSKTAGPSTLSVVFDHGDCEGHLKQELTLRLISVAGGEGHTEALHNALPSEVAGGGRTIHTEANSIGQVDQNLGAEVAPASVHAGLVSGLPKIKLTPEGGPRCSALLTSQERSLRLDSGTEFIMMVQQSSTP